MFWIRSGLHSISLSDWLTAGPAVAANVVSATASIDDARRAMLDALGAAGARKRATLELRIRTARDAASLWELRSELMMVASQIHGELEGRKRLAAVTSLFDGLLPVASSARSRKGAGVPALR